MPKILLILPPFIQPNCPYPSTLSLTGFLKQQGYKVTQADLSLTCLLKLFSKNGLACIFAEVIKTNQHDEESNRILSLKNKYINCIEPIIAFLQGKNSNIAHRIIQDGFLPKGPLFFREANESEAFGTIGIQDKAKYYASLMLDELTLFIQKTISPDFGLSRYAEKLAQSPPTFDPLLQKAKDKNDVINQIIIEEGEKLWEKEKPDVVGFSIPFPGNFLSSLLLAENFRSNNPNGKVIFGGGYVNTELRNISDKRIFKFADYLTLDDGEMPVLQILRNFNSKSKNKKWVRTFFLEGNKVLFQNDYSGQTIPHDQLPAPSLDGIRVNDYLSFTELLNPMHRLWSDGFWHKITAAHGCYWHKCTFCDTSLDYIKRYDPAKAETIVDWMENLIQQSGISAFHFTDEAAPPALLKKMALEILRRKLTVSWWGNIRFDKSFTADTCRLLAKSGCIAVSGGIEVADKRVLKLVNKGITLEHAVEVCSNFQQTGIMVHSYLMYGFPSQSEVETINSLEYVRQFFYHQLINSAFWHQFSLTIHSPICQAPEKYKIKIFSSMNNPFANNDLLHEDISGTKNTKYAVGLNKAIYNYMHGIGLDWDVIEWFDFPTPLPKADKKFVEKQLNNIKSSLNHEKNSSSIWTGANPTVIKTKKLCRFVVNTADMEAEWEIDEKICKWLMKMLKKSSIPKTIFPKFSEWETEFPGSENQKNLFFKSDVWRELKEVGLLFI